MKKSLRRKIIDQTFALFKRRVNEFSNPRRKKGQFYVPKELLKYADFKELLALKEGLKPSVGIRMPFEPKAYQSAKKWAKENSFRVGHTPYKYIINSDLDICEPVPLNSPKKGDVYVIIAKSFDIIKRAADSYAKNVVEFGRIMGYPDCCLEFAKKLCGNLGNEGKIKEDWIWSRSKFRCFRNSKYFSYYLNIFHGFGLVPHIPCHLNCKPSKKYAKDMLKLIAQEDAVLAKCEKFFLKTASLFWSNMDYVLLRGKLHKNKFIYHDNMPFFSSGEFYMIPDKNRLEQLKTYFSLIERGNTLEFSDYYIKVFYDDGLIGIIDKKTKYECILAKPDGK